MTKTPVQMAVEALDDAQNHLLRMSQGHHVDGTLPMNYNEWVGHCLDGHLATIHAALQTPVWNTDMESWKPIDDWHEDIGNAFWTVFPVTEPYYSGSPLDLKWPGYHTHFIPMRVFNHLLDARGYPVQPTPAGVKK